MSSYGLNKQTNKDKNGVPEVNYSSLKYSIKFIKISLIMIISKITASDT